MSALRIQPRGTKCHERARQGSSVCLKEILSPLSGTWEGPGRWGHDLLRYHALDDAIAPGGRAKSYCNTNIMRLALPAITSLLGSPVAYARRRQGLTMYWSRRPPDFSQSGCLLPPRVIPISFHIHMPVFRIEKLQAYLSSTCVDVSQHCIPTGLWTSLISAIKNYCQT